LVTYVTVWRRFGVQETDGGSVELLGAEEPVVTSAEEALQLVAEAKTRRATASTAANATSSRSHCVTRITTAGPSGQGTLTLVDCAGSERNADSMHHDARARKECAEINASLYALRECVRLRRRQAEEAKHPGGGKHVHVPYRSSQLTRVLMECFTSPDALVAVIATVPPLPSPLFPWLLPTTFVIRINGFITFSTLFCSLRIR
jgi:kinesin family protein 2/24